MMSHADLLTAWIEAADETVRRQLLEAQAPLQTDFFRELKQQVRQRVEVDSQAALQLADLGIEATQFAADHEGVAYAWWARGNALLFLGRYDDCLSAYATAIPLFARAGALDNVAQLQTNSMVPLMWTGRHAEAQAMGQSALEVLGDQAKTTQRANLLLNLAICARHQGAYATAAQRAEEAADIFASLKQPVQAARSRVTQSIALEYLDRFAEAETWLQDALDIFDSHDAHVPWARAALNLGVLQARLSRHQTALTWLERSRAAFLDAGIDVDAAVGDLYRTQTLLDLNLLPEAQALAERLVNAFTALEMPRQVARAASLLAQVYARRDRLDPACEALTRARRIFRTQGDTVEVARLDLQRAVLLRRQGRPGAGLRLAAAVTEQLDVRHHPLRHAEAHRIVAACCEDLGRIDEAQLAYQVAWEAGSHVTESTAPPPSLAYRIAFARGTIAEAAGARALARGAYRRAVHYLQRVTQGLGLDELRGSFLTDKRPVYEAALRMALEDGEIHDAFQLSELARAGALCDVLSQALTAPRGDREATAELSHLQARWAWRASRLHRPVDLMAEVDEERVSPEDRAVLLRELAALEHELRARYRRQRLTDPRFAGLPAEATRDVASVQQHLPEDAALLAFDQVGDRVLAFVVTQQRIEVVQLGEMAPLRWEIRGVRHALEEVRLFTAPSDIARLEVDLRRDLTTLYEMLLAKPLAILDPQVQHLHIVPGAGLHALPLGALYDGHRHLIERYTLSYLPAAGLLTTLPRRQTGAGRRALILAYDDTGHLPGVVKEGEQVRQVLAGLDETPVLLQGEAATRQALREHVGACGVLHVTAHGRFRADAPLFSGVQLVDAPLTAHEIYNLDLSRAALVTLSACQTGLAQGRGGELLGLTQACFFAGAPTVVVSRWRVDDATTVQLMADFYAGLVAGQSVADALRDAQRTLLATHPHAGYWAPFAVWGRGDTKLV